jgi:hypothetical protein
MFGERRSESECYSCLGTGKPSSSIIRSNVGRGAGTWSEFVVELQGTGCHRFLKVGVPQSRHSLVEIGQFQIVGGHQAEAIPMRKSGNEGTASEQPYTVVRAFDAIAAKLRSLI